MIATTTLKIPTRTQEKIFIGVLVKLTWTWSAVLRISSEWLFSMAG
jgi:hypothetical protein